MFALYNHYAKYICFLFLAFSLLVAGCDTNDRYDQKFNPAREKLFLPLITESWKPCFRWISSERTWVVNDVRRGPRHAMKKYRWNEAGLISESDTYYSGKRLPALASDPDRLWVDESLIIIYYFQDNPSPSKAGDWFCYYFGQIDRELKVEEAMMLLKKWGLWHPLMNKTTGSGNVSEGGNP